MIDHRADAHMPAVGQTERALLAKVAGLLFSNGQTTEKVRIAVERLGTLFGCEARLMIRWGELAILSDEALLSVPHIAEPLGIDIGRVVAAEGIVDDLCLGQISATEGLAALREIERRPPVSVARFVVMAAAGAAALGVIFGAADPLTLLLIAGSAGLGACLRRAASRVTSNPFAQPLLASILAGGIASVASALDLDVSHRLVAACPCMVLVPGPHFLNGMIDLARARMALGIARLAFANLLVLAISTGLLVGLSVGGAKLGGGGSSAPVPLVYDVCAAGVAVAAYGSFFNMPWQLMPLPIGVGMIAHCLRWQMLNSGASIEASAFSACLLVGVVVSALAYRFRVPFGAFAFASVVSLMPGVFMFQAASEALALIAPDPAASPLVEFALVRNSATALVILLAMTAGLILPRIGLDEFLSRR